MSSSYQKYDLMLIIIPLMFLVKIIGDNKEGKFRKEMFRADLKNNKDTKVVMDYFEDYRIKCHYTHKPPLEFEEWKEKERSKLKSNIEEDKSSSQH